MQPSANIAVTNGQHFPEQESNNTAVDINAIVDKALHENTSSENTSNESSRSIPENLAKAPEDTHNTVLANERMRKLKDFGELAEKASIFEFGMALLGSIVTGFQSDWISYMHEAFGEFSENHLVAADEGHKEVNPIVKKLLQFVSFLFGIKNKEGQNLETTNDFVKNQDRLIGGLNMLTSTISGLVIAFKGIPAAITGKQSLDFGAKSPFVSFITTKLFPTINASLMWMTGAVKRRLAFDIQKHSYNGDNKEEINGAFTSGNQDYICGSNSAALMIRQAVGAVNPKLGNLLEPILATWIAGSAFKEGYSNFAEHPEEEPKFQLNKVDKSSMGIGFYNLARNIAKPLGVELPELNTLAA